MTSGVNDMSTQVLERELHHLKDEVQKLDRKQGEFLALLMEIRDSCRDMAARNEWQEPRLQKMEEDIADYKIVKSRLLGGAMVIFFTFGVLWEGLKFGLAKLTTLTGGG